MANQKSGMLDPLTEKTRVRWSGNRSRLDPAKVPKVMPRVDGHQPGGSGQLHGGRELAPEYLGHWGDGYARPTEVPAQDPAGPGEILHRKRVVQAVAVLELFDFLGCHLV